ncbi:MAG: AMIN domain-containing protein [Candidatus Electrothrix sp. MAN1_4]|nr:AMIN domain-containing protein [Candidatus Electrothrix sp. MAN1_4]
MFLVVPYNVQCLRTTFFRVLLLLLLLLTGLPSITTAATTSSYKNTVDWQYKQANDYYYTLRNNPSLAGKREKWLTGVQELQRIYRIEPKSKRAASCLYTIARMYRAMYERFGNTADLDKAVSLYKDVESFFPKSKKADNALYALAQIEQEEKGNFKQAVQYYDQLMHAYPASNKRRLVKQQLKKLIAVLEKNPEKYQKSQVEPTKPPKKVVVLPSVQELPSLSPQKIAPPSQTTPPAEFAPPVITPESRKTIQAENKAQKPAKRVIPEKRSTPRQHLVPQQTISSLQPQQDTLQGKENLPRTKIILSALKKVESGQKQFPLKAEKKQKQVDTSNKYLKKVPGTVEVLPVQYWSSDNYTRVVIKSSEPVDYHVNLLHQQGYQQQQVPRHLLIDFKKSYIPVQYRSPVVIKDGLLQHIQTSQLDATTVRVSLDMESIGDYKVFNLKDPFRVVVDVRGDRGRALRIPKRKVAPQIITDIKPPVLPLTPPKLAAVQKTEKKEETEAPSSIENLSVGVEVAVETTHDAAEKTAIKILTPKGRKTVPPLATAKQSEKTPVPENLTLAQQLGLGVRRIVIDPGHGGKDPGAVGFGLKEKDIVLNVAQKIKKTLEEKNGYEVFLTRDGDVSLSLEERTAIANTKEADLFLSIHVNAHPEKNIRGVETFYLNLATHTEAMRVAALENATSTHNMSEMQDILSELMQNEKINESSQLAEFVQLNMVNGLKRGSFYVKDLGVKQAPFYVLIGAEMPAILAEIAFITNPKDAQLMKNERYLQTLADYIVAGVLSYVKNQRTAALKTGTSSATSMQ